MTSYEHLRRTLLASLGFALVTSCGGEGMSSSSDSSTSPSSTTDESTTDDSSETTPTTDATTTETSDSEGSTVGPSTSETSDASTDTPTTDGTTDGPDGCVDPQPIDQDYVEPGNPSGFVECASGAIVRPEQLDCLSPVTPSSCVDNSDGGCGSDADCVDGEYGSCQQDQVFGGLTETTTCHCVYGCVTDTDCDAGEVCRCAGSGLGQYTECVPADCSTNDDCGAYDCALSPDYCAPGGFLLTCQGPDDECHGVNECESANFCAYETDSWACVGVDCGRPFTVDGRGRIAGTKREVRASWVEPVERTIRESSRAAAYWQKLMLLEHASVASFARFLNQLLQLGAPAKLVAKASRALADEVRHTQLCGGLARAFGGAKVEPAQLDIRGAVVARDSNVDTITRGLIDEACLGETLSALEAYEAASGAQGVVRERLQQIAEDEFRHATLGWKTLQWILVSVSDTQRQRIIGQLHEALQAEALPLTGCSDDGAEANGILSSRARRQVRLRGIQQVIKPCVDALVSAGELDCGSNYSLGVLV